MKPENTKNSNNENSFNELRDIRKDKGLTIEDIARELRLSSDIIRKIEQNDLSSLGAYTYVRGYIIHYTNLLGINPDKFIDLIPKSEIEVPLVNTAASNSTGIKFKRQSKNMASYALGTFIVIAVSFSGWYLLNNYTQLAKNRNIEMVDNNQLEIAPQQSLALDNEPFKPDAAPTNTEELYHYSSLIPDIQNSSEDENKNIEIPEQNTPLETSEENLQPENTVFDSTTYHITVKADKTSWVKVEHLNGEKKLYNDLLKPGEITFESIEPVHFRIGNSENVKIIINGKNIDLSEHSRKNIADFNWPLDS
ncbi:MAG: DUF4115 domain-containing protein [Proteobacteria bacterium]|nr:DUF4115 domain-containing protein [Pseudomonadota bacterium]